MNWSCFSDLIVRLGLLVYWYTRGCNEKVTVALKKPNFFYRMLDSFFTPAPARLLYYLTTPTVNKSVHLLEPHN
jgi:hypothetical protein